MSDRLAPQPNRPSEPACAAYLDLLPAYALGGIDLADRALIEQHLRSCERCRHELDILSMIADSLPLSLPMDQLPDPESWQVIAERIKSEDAGLPVVAASLRDQPPVDPAIVATPSVSQPSRWVRYLPAALVAPLALALIFLGAWANGLQNDLDAQDASNTAASISPEMLNDSSVHTYAVERSCTDCQGSGQVGLSASSQMGMLVAWDFDPDQDHMVWGVTANGEMRKVCQLYVNPTGAVMQTFMLPDSAATLREIYITDEEGHLIYVAHLRPVDPVPTAAPIIN